MKASDIAERILTGGWRAIVYMDGSEGATNIYRSLADPRVQVRKHLPKRGMPITTFTFGDRAVDVAITPGGPIVEEADHREFATIRELSEAIAEHDAALRSERDWRDADPSPATGDAA